MQINPTAQTAYNKFNKQSQGTLIGNWYEERELRDATGIGRTIPGEHIKKTRENLFTKLPEELAADQTQRQTDNTNERILGQKRVDWPDSENHLYGTGFNKADILRKQGEKTLKREEFFLQQIQQELKEIEQKDIEDANSRQFNTTTKDEYYKKDGQGAGNVLGKRVMKTQNGQPIPDVQKEDDLFIDQGLRQRPQFLTDDQLKKYLPRGESYLTQQPITFWQEKQHEGVFYQSKQNVQNPKKTFALNNDFLKTYSEYAHNKE